MLCQSRKARNSYKLQAHDPMNISEISVLVSRNLGVKLVYYKIVLDSHSANSCGVVSPAASADLCWSSNFIECQHSRFSSIASRRI